jgi:hypothetical protein
VCTGYSASSSSDCPSLVEHGSPRRADLALGVCDYAQFSLRSDHVTPCRKLTEVAYHDIASVRVASRTHVVIALRTGLQIERAISDDAEDLAEQIRQRLTGRPAVPSPSPPPAANPPFVMTVTAGAPQLAAAAERRRNNSLHLARAACCGDPNGNADSDYIGLT